MCRWLYVQVGTGWWIVFDFSAEYDGEEVNRPALIAQVDKLRNNAAAMLSVANGLVLRSDGDINPEKLGEMVEEELNATQEAIESGAKKIQVGRTRRSNRGLLWDWSRGSDHLRSPALGVLSVLECLRVC